MIEISGTSPAAAITAGVGAIYLQAGVPKTSLKETMMSGAVQWGGHPFLSAILPTDLNPPSEVHTPSSWASLHGHASSARRRYWAFTRHVSVLAPSDGQTGETLHCRIREGNCKWGHCDAD